MASVCDSVDVATQERYRGIAGLRGVRSDGRTRTVSPNNAVASVASVMMAGLPAIIMMVDAAEPERSAAAQFDSDGLAK
jgi:hypothetical protein